MISLKRQFINTTIAERYATIIYSFDFENTRNLKNHSDELKFAITIDPDAFIAGFTADIDGELFIGRTEEKAEAKQQYTAAKEKNENAILISQPNKDISNVFEIKTNIDSGSKISLNITIEQYLKKQFGYNQLNIQLLNDFGGTTISKSYSDMTYKFIIKDKRGISGLTIPLYNGSIDNKNKFLYDIAGTITSQQLSLTNELVLKYKVGGEADESSLLFDKKTNTFCHIISDVLTDAQEENASADTEGGDNQDGDEKIGESILIPRRVVFVIDKSGSMGGNKWNFTVKATVMALRKLRNGIDRYRIILCGSQLDYIPKNINILELVEESSINNSINYLQAQRATGAEQLNQGLLEGIKAIKFDIIKLNNDKNVEYNFFMNQIIFISDGRPTIGETNVDKIITNVKNANDISKIDKYSNKISVFSFGVGRDGNGSQWMNDLPHAFLKSMSVNNNGFYKRIKQQTADTELTEYIDILSKPISTNIKVKYESQQPNISDLTQTKFNSLYKGNDLVICGKLDLNKKSVTNSITATISAIRCKQVQGKNNKLLFKPITINKILKMNVDHGDDDNKENETQNVERIWAYLSLQQHATKKLKYNDMIEMDDDEQKEEDKTPLQLAMQYKFVTPWTSMIVVKQKTGKDKDIQDTDDQKQEKQEKQPVTIPAPSQPPTVVTHTRARGKMLPSKPSPASHAGPLMPPSSSFAPSYGGPPMHSQPQRQYQQSMSYSSPSSMQYKSISYSAAPSMGSFGKPQQNRAYRGAAQAPMSNSFNAFSNNNNNNNSMNMRSSSGNPFTNLANPFANVNPPSIANVHPPPPSPPMSRKMGSKRHSAKKKRGRKKRKEKEIVQKSIQAYNKNGIEIMFKFGSGEGIILVEICNNNSYDVMDFELQITVPEYIKLKIKSANATKLLANSKNSIQQTIILNNTMHGTKPYAISVEIVYMENGKQKTDKSQIIIPNDLIKNN